MEGFKDLESSEYDFIDSVFSGIIHKIHIIFLLKYLIFVLYNRHKFIFHKSRLILFFLYFCLYLYIYMYIFTHMCVYVCYLLLAWYFVS